jgi:hypothetical protein
MEILSIQSSLAALEQMSYAELVQYWHETFHHPPPVQCGKPLMRGALAWQIQAKRYGGLSYSEWRGLRQSVSSHSNSQNLAVGSRLVRVWQGHTHQVSVLENGFEHNGQHYESLSAIARAITGTPWSGPVFFGLKKGKNK